MKRNGNIVLVGMMGAGKSTVGRIVAGRLKREFRDTDLEIERRCGVRIAVIFDIEGEAAFRQREATVLAELCALDGVVLATGGGAVLAEQNRRQLARCGAVVYLHARPRELWRRVRHDRNRPLLATANPLGKLEELYALRDPLYRGIADVVLDTGAQSVQALARELLARLELVCSLST